MDDCPNCEYHRQRAQRWRDEAYKQSGHPLPEREWVGLTDEDLEAEFGFIDELLRDTCYRTEAKLKEKNT